MKRIEFRVPGQPAGLQRHRTTVRKCGERYVPRNYDPPANSANKAMIATCAVMAMRKQGVQLMSGAVGLRITARFTRPKSHFGTGRNSESLKDSAPVAHTAKPDFDNIAKLVCDALNGVVWRDDAQIPVASIRKFWTTQGGATEVEVWELSNSGVDAAPECGKNERHGVKAAKTQVGAGGSGGSGASCFKNDSVEGAK